MSTSDSTLSSHERDELDRLRSRAYGAEADIAGDPAALRRLDELEERVRAGASSGERAAAAPPQDPPADLSVGLSPETARASTEPPSLPNESSGFSTEPSVEQGDPHARVAAKVRRRRVRVVVWASSLVVAAVVAAAVTATVLISSPRAVPYGYEVRHVATLQIDPDFDNPMMLGAVGEDTFGYESFYGLTAVETTTAWGYSGTDSLCLLILVPAELSTNDGEASYSGPFFNGCGAGDFPPVVQFEVGPELPQEMRDHYPEGTGIQFVLRGDEVDVYTD